MSDDIIQMAKEAGAIPSGDPQEWDVWLFQDPAMERFAALVAAAEREACARICEDAAQRWRDAGWDDYSMLLKDAAHQLRLRNPP